MKTIYVKVYSAQEAEEYAKPLQNFKGLHTSHCRFVLEESRGKNKNRACEIYFRERADGMRCDIPCGFGELGK